MRVFRKAPVLMFIAAIMSVCILTGPNTDAKENKSASKEKVDKVVQITVQQPAVPEHQYFGMPFAMKGKVRSNHKLLYVRSCILTSKGKVVNKSNVIVKLKKKSFNLKKISGKMPFAHLKAGEYRYYVEARAVKGKKSVLINKAFTVSKISGKKISKPSSKHIKGMPFSMNGKIKSKYKLKKVCVGVTTKSGKWIKGFYKIKKYKVKKSKSRTFDISSVDPHIKFGDLSAGTYRYKVYASDEFGQEKYLVDKKFKITRSTPAKRSVYSTATGKIKKKGYRLSFNTNVISAIGAQPVSGPCGQYAMAYARAVIDGTFPLNSKYKSYYKQFYNEYGFKSHYAYWYRADGRPVWYQTCKNCYKAALKEIASGRPCIINLHNRGTGNNHFVTVIGYVAGTDYNNVSLSSFIALDPGYGRMVYLKDMNYSDSDNPQAVFF